MRYGADAPKGAEKVTLIGAVEGLIGEIDFRMHHRSTR
jgi:hypothetical protein